MSDDNSLGVLLATVFRALEQRVLERTRQVGVMPLTDSQAKIALFITEEGVRLTELAERSRVAKQTVAALIDRMEEGGWVERVPDPTDGRARLIRFTKNAVETWGLGPDEEATILAEWSEVLGPERMRQLCESLSVLRGHVEATPYVRGAKTVA